VRRERILALATVVLATGVALLAAEWLLRTLDARVATSTVVDPGLLRYHARLGWTLTPFWTGRHRHHDFDVTYAINAYGFRGDFPSPDAAKRRPRVAVLGDSFTFGLGVEDDRTFVALLARAVASHEHLNFAVPGYSPDQSLLQFDEQVAAFAPDEIWLALYLGNDAVDVGLDYPLQADQAKPRFALVGGDLVLENVPVPREAKPARLRTTTLEDAVFADSLAARRTVVEKLRLQSHLLARILPPQTFDPATLERVLDARLAASTALLRVILDALRRDVARPVRLLLLPGQSFVEAPASPSALFQDHVRRALLDERGATDVASAMRERCAEQACFHRSDGHYTVAGHRIVADIVRDAAR
jgi:hypothetical protein